MDQSYALKSRLQYNTNHDSQHTERGAMQKRAIRAAVNKPHAFFFRFSFLVVDVLAINIVFFTLLYVMDRVTQSRQYIILLLASNICWIIASYATAVYFATERFFRRSIQAFGLFLMFTVFFIFINKYDFSRLFILLNFVGYASLLGASRMLYMGTQHFIENRVVAKKIIILGYNGLSQRLVSTFKLDKQLFEIHGYFDDSPDIDKEEHYPLLGSIRDSLQYAIANGITDIYSTIPPENHVEIYKVAQEAERNFIRFKFVPDFRIFINRKVHVGFEYGMPVLSLRTEPLQNIQNRFKKRVFDIVFSSLVILLILSWLIPLIAILIKLTSRGPVFFKQLRSGKNNQSFLCFKFRSLKVNNEADSKQVERNDTRFTWIGKILRKTNIDELPQFFNVFQGYMSVVGPRPHMLKHTEDYGKAMDQYMVRHFVKPGVTGWAQINGYRGEIKREEQLHLRVEHDIEYMESWSMWLDLRIIVLTVYTSIIGDRNAV